MWDVSSPACGGSAWAGLAHPARGSTALRSGRVENRLKNTSGGWHGNDGPVSEQRSALTSAASVVSGEFVHLLCLTVQLFCHRSEGLGKGYFCHWFQGTIPQALVLTVRIASHLHRFVSLNQKWLERSRKAISSYFFFLFFLPIPGTDAAWEWTMTHRERQETRQQLPMNVGAKKASVRVSGVTYR